jgi:hypothetical protein
VDKRLLTQQAALSMEPGTRAISSPDARPLSDEGLVGLYLRALHGGELGFAAVDVVEWLAGKISPERLSRLTSLMLRKLP